MKLKPTLINFCSIIAFCSLAGLSSAETLEEIYHQALENDHQYRAAIAAFDAGKEAINLGRSALLPQVNATAVMRDFERETTVDGSIDPLQDTDNRTTGYTISLEQVLFSMNAWHSYKSGAANTKAAEAGLKSAEQDLMIRTASAYFNALEAVDNLTTATAEEEALKHQLEQTRQRFQVGLTAITEVHEAQAAYDTSRVDRLNAEGQLGIAFEALEVITGRPNNELSPLKEEFPVVDPSPTNREDWVDFAMKNNHRLSAALFQSDAASQSAKAARAGHYPSVQASVNYGNDTFETNNLDPITALPVADADREDTTFAISLNVPLFAGGATSATSRREKANAVQARENFLQTQRDVVQQTRSLHLAVVTGAASVKAREQAITSSQSALDATQAGYEVGTRDLVDVLNAQRNLFRAQRDYSAALYLYVITSLQLKEAAGTLSPQDIVELSNWLNKAETVSRYPNS